jgi:cysteine sulfinate desulfinase/cysteine desulfurase-like protein
MDIPDPIARGAIRFSLGRETTAEEIDAVVQCLAAPL